MATDLPQDTDQPRVEVSILTAQQVLHICKLGDRIADAVRRANNAAAMDRLRGDKPYKRGRVVTQAKRNLFNYLINLKS